MAAIFLLIQTFGWWINAVWLYYYIANYSFCVIIFVLFVKNKGFNPSEFSVFHLIHMFHFFPKHSTFFFKKLCLETVKSSVLIGIQFNDFYQKRIFVQNLKFVDSNEYIHGNTRYTISDINYRCSSYIPRKMRDSDSTVLRQNGYLGPL